MPEEKRGAYGRGSVEKRGDNKYRITVRLGRKPDGSYDRYRETYHGSRQQAEKRRTELLHQLDTGRFANPSSVTFGEFLERWYRDYAEVQTEEGTHKKYKDYIDNRIVPALGKVPITKLSPMHIDHFYASLQRDGARRDGKSGGLSPSTVRKIHACVHESLKHAVQWHLIPYNPSDNASLPKVHKAEKRLWSALQLQEFLKVLRNSRYKALILTLAFTGMRAGEAYALMWPDVDFENRLIKIAKSLKKPGRDPTIGDTKNHQSRTVPIDDELYTALKTHRSQQNETKLKMGAAWNPLNLVFTTEAGTAMYHSNFREDVWAPLVKKAKVPYINIHGLRHTFATLLMSSDIDAKVVSEMLGHHSVAFTLDQYNHPGQEEQRRALSIFSRRVKES